MDQIPDYYDDLDASLAFALDLIDQGARYSRSQFHVFQFASIDPGGAPNVRSVVLRGFDHDGRILRFHTDCYALKLRSIENNPRTAAHFYDREKKIQVRLQGTAEVRSDGPVYENAWVNTQPMSKACYGSSPPPGTIIDNGGDYRAEAVLENPEHGRDAFRVILMRFDRLDWLYLHASGHRRAAFEWAQGSSKSGVELTAKWLVP